MRRLVAALFLLAVTFGFGSSLHADASGAPYIIKRTLIPVDGTCTLTYIEYSNGDWTFIEGPGC